MNSSLFEPLRTCAEEIREVIQGQRGRGYSGARETQYHLDVAADEVAMRVLVGSGFRVFSEESGVSGEGEFTVVVDPIDGSTNCDRGIPFYATSFAVMRGEELVAGLVMNQATATVYEAEKGSGARRDGVAIRSSGQRDLSEAVVGFSGLAERNIGWAQNRSMGAASLEICLVADGSLDAYGVAQRSTLNTWDYLGGLIVAREAGAVDADYRGEALVTSDDVVRRPIFAATSELLQHFLDAGTL